MNSTVHFDGTVREHGWITVHSRITVHKQITVLRKLKPVQQSQLEPHGILWPHYRRLIDQPSSRMLWRHSILTDDILSRAMTLHT